ncbi:MAG TPA: hypothetical protein VHM25_01255 [Polyangiaceae bacterium]|nr:hypothetical protein [Polyangiaceae bacterium]
MSTHATSESDFEQRFSQIEQLLDELSRLADPRPKQATRKILATLLELHKLGLARMLAATDEGARRELARDAQVSAMLLLHDLHPLSLSTRVTRAVDTLRERLHGKLEEVRVDARDGRVALRVVPVKGTCGSTRATLKRQFEEALLAAAPDAESVLVELTEPAPALVTLRLRRSADDGDGELSNGGPR